jgi:hypothetical protein
MVISILIIECTSRTTNNADDQKVEIPIKHELPKIYAKIFTSIGTGDKAINKDSMTIVNSPYFEISITSVNNGEKYMATKQIEKPQVGKIFKSVTLNLVDSSGTVIYFKESTEFLNYMEARGYNMVDQEKQRFGSDYTFKKRD